MFDVEWALIAGVVAILPIVAEAYVREFGKKERKHSFTWRVGSGIAVTAIIVPIVFSAGTAISRAYSTSYYEFWNGIEVSANANEVACVRDGMCYNSFNCDPYTVVESYTDQDGNIRTRQVTKYHRCPYVTKEMRYSVNDTLGNDYVYDRWVFPEDAENHKFRDDIVLPDDVQRGPGEEWLRAKERISQGNPLGTSVQKSYSNYLLPIQNSVYEKYSDEIPEFLENGMLPTPTNKIYDRYLTDKVYFVGFDKDVANRPQWVKENGVFGGVMGNERQGDIHLVIVNADKAGNPDKYTQALNAYWLSTSDLGAYTLSKNGIVIVVGATQVGLDKAQKNEELNKTRTILSLKEIKNGEKPVGAKNDGVKWVRAFTGMPQGNEVLVAKLSSEQTVKDLQDSYFHPTGIYSSGSPIPKILSDYHRIEMKNYEYLKGSIPAGTFANVTMLILSVAISLGVTFLVQFDRRK